MRKMSSIYLMLILLIQLYNGIVLTHYVRDDYFLFYFIVNIIKMVKSIGIKMHFSIG